MSARAASARHRSRGRIDRPARSDVLWRSSRNPIIPRDLLPRSNSIFNSAVVPFGDGFAGVFRVDDRPRTMNIHAGRSADGMRWDDRSGADRVRAADDRASARSRSRSSTPTTRGSPGSRTATTSPGATATTARRSASGTRTTSRRSTSSTTRSCRSTATACCSRAGSAAATLMLSRPSDNGHTPFGDIFYSESPDLVHWGRHRHVMAPIPGPGSRPRSAPGPRRSRRREGWLLLYHGVLTSCNGFVYSMGAALLDLDEPWKRRRRGARLPPVAADAVRAGRRRARTSCSRARRSSTRRRTASRSTTAARTRSPASPTPTSPSFVAFARGG